MHRTWRWARCSPCGGIGKARRNLVTSEARSPSTTTEAKRSLRLSLSLTDVLFLAVLVLLVYGHLQNVASGKVLSAAFVLQQVIVIVFMLLHRPLQGAPAPWQDVLL